jgi:hypothetical protein
MADKNILAQMLEHLVNDDQAKAEELFHEYVVSKSREIYEDLIESEIQDEEVDEASEEDEEAVEEATEEDVEESTDEDMDENFEDIAYEADEEEPAFGGPEGDATDDLAGEMGPEDNEFADKSEEELFQDLDSIVDELQAKFDAIKGGGEEEMGGEEEPAEEGFGEPQLATVREYVEKVPAGHGAEKKGSGEGAMVGTGKGIDQQGGKNTKSVIDNMKNDMGGTTANIAQTKEDQATYANQGQLKGTGLEKGKVSDNPDAKGNVNVPGGNAGKTGFKTKEPGHGAEKKGGAEGTFSGAGGSAGATDKASLFRGRR